MNAVCPRHRQRMLPLESRDAIWHRTPRATQEKIIELLSCLIVEHVRMEVSVPRDMRRHHER
jgi:hypothetical protein